MYIESINTVVLVYIAFGIFALIILLLVFLPYPKVKKKHLEVKKKSLLKLLTPAYSFF